MTFLFVFKASIFGGKTKTMEAIMIFGVTVGAFFRRH